MFGLATKTPCLSKLSLVLGAESSCAVDDLGCLGRFNNNNGRNGSCLTWLAAS